MPRHLTLAELIEGRPDILGSPQDNGTLVGIVLQAEPGAGHPRRPLDQGRRAEHGRRVAASRHPDLHVSVGGVLSEQAALRSTLEVKDG